MNELRIGVKNTYSSLSMCRSKWRKFEVVLRVQMTILGDNHNLRMIIGSNSLPIFHRFTPLVTHISIVLCLSICHSILSIIIIREVLCETNVQSHCDHWIYKRQMNKEGKIAIRFTTYSTIIGRQTRTWTSFMFHTYFIHS